MQGDRKATRISTPSRLAGPPRSLRSLVPLKGGRTSCRFAASDLVDRG